MFLSNFYGLSQPQNGYEFFDPDINRDTRKFVDPFIISRQSSDISRTMTHNIYAFMDHILSLVRNNQRKEAYELCKHLYETQGTCLGYATQQLEGRGAGHKKAEIFVDALFDSKAVMCGQLRYLEELALFCEGIGNDLISDISIALTRQQLIEFTQRQCRKHGIPVSKSKKQITYYCTKQKAWLSDYFELPHVLNGSRQIILIPCQVVMEKTSYQHPVFYLKIAVKYFEKIAIQENLSCVKKLKNGGIRVLRKELKKYPRFSVTKANMTNFILNHPETLHKFRNEFFRV